MTRTTWSLLMLGETLAVAVNAWSVFHKWNSPWWAFSLQAIMLALVCGAATVVVVMWRRYSQTSEKLALASRAD